MNPQFFGTGFFTVYPLNTNIHVALQSTSGFFRYAIQITGTAADVTPNLYANGCVLANCQTGAIMTNTGNDGAIPTWQNAGNGVGAGISLITKIPAFNLNQPTQSTMVLSTVTGTFVAGETVKGSSSNATAVVVVGGTTSIVVKSIVGTFTVSDSVVGQTSAAHGTWVSNTVLSGIDTLVNISSGALFFPTSAIVTNASTSLTTASGIQIWTGPGRTGTEIASTTALSSLTTSAKVLAMTINDTTSTFTTPLYVSLTTEQGAPATADIYLYGYVLA